MASEKVYVDLDFQSIARILNLQDAASSQEPVTLQQLNNFLLGRRWKEPARVAATGNTTLTAPGASIDGITLTTGDRVVLPAQTAPAENGIWIFNGASSTMTRSPDADSAAELNGAVVPVTEGTANHDKIYNQTGEIVTLGTTAVSFTNISGTAVVAGNGLTGTSTISVLLDTASGLVVSGTGLKIDTTKVVQKFYKTNASGATETITHNLNNSYPQISAFLLSTGEEIRVKKSSVDANNSKIDYNASQTAATIGIVIQG